METLRCLSALAAFSILASASSATEQSARLDSPTRDQLVRAHIRTLETMISMWPKREYYLELAGRYGYLGNLRSELELYEIAYAMGWLTQPRQMLHFARLLLCADRPDELDEALREMLQATNGPKHDGRACADRASSTPEQSEAFVSSTTPCR